MYLKVKNFKTWEEAEFEIADGGITLLSGASGAGKTSILQAIYFALYGKGTKVVRLGNTSCRVELVAHGMHVVRTKRPNRVVLDGKYEDAVAQKLIDQRFGRNFDLVSYVEQDAFKSLVYMTPGARLEFLEGFAFEDVDMERVKGNLKGIVRQAEDKRLSAQTESEFCSRTLAAASVPIPVAKPAELRPDIQSLKSAVDAATNHQASARAQLDAARQMGEQAAESGRRLAALEVELAVIESELIGMDYSAGALAELRDELAQAESHMTYISTKNGYESAVARYRAMRLAEETEWETRVSALRAQLWPAMPRSDAVAQLGALRDQAAVYRRYTQLKARSELLRPSRDEYERLQPVIGIPAECPSCRCKLTVSENCVFAAPAGTAGVSVSTETIDALRKAHSDYILCASQLAEITVPAPVTDDQLACLEKYIAENDRVSHEIEQPFKPSTTLSDIARECKALRTNLSAMPVPAGCDLSASTCILSERVEALRTSIAREKQRELAHSRLAAAAERVRADIALVRLSRLTARSDADTVKRLEDELAAAETASLAAQTTLSGAHGVETRWVEYAAYTSRAADYDRLVSDAGQAAAALQAAESGVAAAYELREIVAQAESACLENIVATINVHAQHFLDAFFTAHPMSAQILTYKEVRSGKTVTTKPQIDLLIEYKGNETDAAALSGGERARLSLAFTLALSEIYQTPLLMLDESISSLDAESTCDVVSALRDLLVDRTVLCVSHQANTGIFDHVIEI